MAGFSSGQGAAELGFPRPALGQKQGETAGLAGDASGQGEEVPAEGLGGCHRLSQCDASGQRASNPHMVLRWAMTARFSVEGCEYLRVSDLLPAVQRCKDSKQE